jgi:hypothetical protein
MQLIARAPDTGRSSSHLSSPRTARVAKAESSRGGGKRTGLSASHDATTRPCLALRFQTGSRTSGVDAHRVHALQGCECREKTHRLKCDPVEVMATVLSRRRQTCCGSKTAVAKEPPARRLGDPRARIDRRVGARRRGRGRNPCRRRFRRPSTPNRSASGHRSLRKSKESVPRSNPAIRRDRRSGPLMPRSVANCRIPLARPTSTPTRHSGSRDQRPLPHRQDLRHPTQPPARGRRGTAGPFSRAGPPLVGPALGIGRLNMATTISTLHSRCDCASRRAQVLADPTRRMSAHRTSKGTVVYYRCYCERPMVALIGRSTGETTDLAGRSAGSVHPVRLANSLALDRLSLAVRAPNAK